MRNKSYAICENRATPSPPTPMKGGFKQETNSKVLLRHAWQARSPCAFAFYCPRKADGKCFENVS